MGSIFQLSITLIQTVPKGFSSTCGIKIARTVDCSKVVARFNFYVTWQEIALQLAMILIQTAVHNLKKTIT